MDFLSPWTDSRRQRRKRSHKLAKTVCLLCLALAGTSASFAVPAPRHFIPRVGHHKRADPTTRASSSLFSSSASSSVAAATTSASSLDPSTYPIIDPTEADRHWTYPLPFDTVLGTNFTTSSCPSFFATFLNSASFQACRPLSLLLSTSTGFFEAQKNATTVLPYVIDQTCNVAASCADTMSAYALKLQQMDICGQDLAAGNALATTALDGFLNYPMFNAIGCQRNATTDNYCITEAAAQSSDKSSEMYWYYLGQGTALPSGTQASCNGCLSDMMAIYGKYATNATLQISGTYSAARTIANSQCGPDFSPLVDIKSAASTLHLSLVLSIAALGLLVAF